MTMGATRGDFLKYPRTPHVFHTKSGATPDDKRLSDEESLAFVRHPGLIVEEKMDGTNVGIHFDADGHPVLQNRGHVIQPGEHAQYDLLKPWVLSVRDRLHGALGERFIMYGEWMYALHTVAYSRLPHYFMEFDVYDKQRDVFLDTASRQALLQGTGVVPVAVIHRGSIAGLPALRKLIGQSLFDDGLAEGLYLKIENDGVVTSRAKFVRPGFTQQIIEENVHWAKRTVVPNRLAEGVSLW